MSETYFTSDHHFFHNNILKHQSDTRHIFDNVYDMNEKMIEIWNSTIKNEDCVYYLGDISFGNDIQTQELLNRLNGKIFYILGNHDKVINKNKEIQKRFEWIKDYYYLKLYNEKIVLCHYCFEIWNQHHYGSWHLYGHSHGTFSDFSNRKRKDIGVDTHNFLPYSFDEIKEVMKHKNNVKLDHHI